MIEIDCRKCIRCNGKECFAYHTDKPDVATKKCANDNFKNYITKENATVEFNGFTQGVIGKKLYADSVLKKMQKSELIELLHLAQHNYNTLMRFYTNAVNANMDKWKEQEEHDKEIRNKAIEEFAEKLSDRLTELSDNATICGVKNVDFITLDTVIDEIGDMAEQMKEVGE